MSQFSARDRMYGLHFSFTLSKLTTTLEKPFHANVRIEDLHQNGSSDITFPVYQKPEQTGVNYVESQLPSPFICSEQHVVIRIFDNRETTIGDFVLPYDFLYKQRVNLGEGRNMDIYRTIIPGIKIKCHLKILRMGSKVAPNPNDTNPWQIAIQELEKENRCFQYWVQTHSAPNLVLPTTIWGAIPCPLYTLLVLGDNAIDDESFECEGPIKFSTPAKFVRPILHDLVVTSRIVDMIDCPLHMKFWMVLELMCGNMSCIQKKTFSFTKIFHPQSNSTYKSTEDCLGNHLCYMHMFYRAYHLSPNIISKHFISYMREDGLGMQFQALLESMSPCILLCSTPNRKGFTVLSGLASKPLLSTLIQRDKCDNFTMVATSPGNYTNSNHMKVHLLAWRDYEENYVIVCLMQQHQDIDHTEYQIAYPHGIDIKKTGHNAYQVGPCLVYSTSFVRCVRKMESILSPALKLNATKTKRPYLHTEHALGEIKHKHIEWIDRQSTTSSHGILWKDGMVDTPKEKWEADHMQSFMGTQNIFVSYAT